MIYIYYSTHPAVHKPSATTNLSDDLAWVINSPPIIQGRRQHCQWTDNHFWQQANTTFTAQADHKTQALQQLIQRQTDYRLGHYFETLLSHWFHTSERYEILKQNLQVQGEQRTLGGFDYLVRDKQTNTTQHWEVACKFYLGIGQTQQIENWYGPMLKDKLGNKFQQMQERQSKLSEQPAARALLDELNIQIDQTICLMKGRLFYPLAEAITQTPDIAANGHLRAWWAKPDDFSHRFKDKPIKWQFLQKKQWLSTQVYNENTVYFSNKDVIDNFHDDYQHPVCIAGFMADESSREIQRGFLVPKDWAKRINIIDNTPS
ncbi:MAG: DUF1853 family protein [Cycloclasticus sp.]